MYCLVSTAVTITYCQPVDQSLPHSHAVNGGSFCVWRKTLMASPRRMGTERYVLARIVLAVFSWEHCLGSVRSLGPAGRSNPIAFPSLLISSPLSETLLRLCISQNCGQASSTTSSASESGVCTWVGMCNEHKCVSCVEIKKIMMTHYLIRRKFSKKSFFFCPSSSVVQMPD